MTPDRIEIGASDILRIAVRIEENGEKFYRQAAQAVQGDARRKFSELADWEAGHRELFSGMLSSGAGGRPSPISAEEAEYLAALGDTLVFAPQLQGRSHGNPSLNDILDFAIQRELDSILYYTEIQPFVAEDRRVAVAKVIEEERRHFRILRREKETGKGAP